MKVLFRVDSGYHIGSGHLRRCLTLARELSSRGCEIHFAGRRHFLDGYELISQSGFQFHNLGEGHLKQKSIKLDFEKYSNPYINWLGASLEDDRDATLKLIRKIGAVDFLITDHYSLNAEWEEAFIDDAKLMVIDDLANRKHIGDILLDANLHEKDNPYEGLCESKTKLLLGLKYILLRPEIRDNKCRVSISDEPLNLLISFGGSDFNYDTLKTIDALKLLSAPYEVNLIYNESWPHSKEIHEKCRSLSEFKLHTMVEHMAGLISNSNLAIGAAGMTLWERCCMGLPAIVVATAHNQVAITERVAKTGAIVYLGESHEVTAEDIFKEVQSLIADPLKCHSLKEAGRKLVDGNGVKRVADEIMSLF